MSDAGVELVQRIRARATAEATAWLDRELLALRESPSVERLMAGFGAASRRLGADPLSSAADASVLGPLDAVPLAHWTVDTAGRTAMLLCATNGRPELLAEAVWSVYRHGDTLEKLAVVRALSLLPEQERFIDLSLDAGRTNDTRLFAAVACLNPFPARHYPELEFNKLYMKAAFVRAPLDQILGLEHRANRELSRMAYDYVSEQEAAARAFPPEIWVAVGFYPPAGAVAKLLGYASHASASMRLGAARGLLHVRQPRIESFVAERLELEADARVRQTLNDTLAALAAARDDRSLSR
jgi:hypothetical protein